MRAGGDFFVRGGNRKAPPGAALARRVNSQALQRALTALPLPSALSTLGDTASRFPAKSSPARHARAPHAARTAVKEDACRSRKWRACPCGMTRPARGCQGARRQECPVTKRARAGACCPDGLPPASRSRIAAARERTTLTFAAARRLLTLFNRARVVRVRPAGRSPEGLKLPRNGAALDEGCSKAAGGVRCPRC
jgi:hypothetical protein